MKSVRNLVRHPSEKWHMRSWILDHFPDGYEGMTYCEPFGGCGSLLMHKKRSKIEIFNDVDESVVSFLRAVRDEPAELCRRLRQQKQTEECFERSLKKRHHDDYIDSAVQDFVLRRLSKRAMKSEYQKPRATDDWKSQVGLVSHFSPRIKEAFILNKDAFDLIPSLSLEECLLYCDPPYLHDGKGAKGLYESDMTPDRHMELYRLLDGFGGKIVLSGCLSPLYKRLYKNWNLSKRKINKSSADGGEVVWRNF